MSLLDSGKNFLSKLKKVFSGSELDRLIVINGEQEDGNIDGPGEYGFDDSERVTHGTHAEHSSQGRQFEGGMAHGKSRFEAIQEVIDRARKETQDPKIVTNMKSFKEDVKEIVKEAVQKAKELKKKKEQISRYTVHPLFLQKDTETEYEIKVKPEDAVVYSRCVAHVRSQISFIKKKLMRLVNDQQYARWIGGERIGKRIDRNVLHRIPTGERNLFKRKVESDIRDVCFSLVVDESGSMYGQKCEQSRYAAIMFGEILNAIKVPFEVIGYTTEGLSEKQRAEQSRYAHCSGSYNRSDNCRHNMYKRFDEKYDYAKVRMAQIGASGANYDQDHMEFVWRRVRKREEKRKVIIWLSDGQPCFLPKTTEALTIDGWKLVENVTMKDKVACFNPDSEEAEYHNPNFLVRKMYRGKINHFNTKKFEAHVTADHNMWTRKKGNRSKDTSKGWEKIPAKDVKGGYQFRSVAKWNGSNETEIKIGEMNFESEDFAKFVLYYLSEGSISGKNIRIYQCEYHNKGKNETFGEIEDLLKKLGLKYSYMKDDKVYVGGFNHNNKRPDGTIQYRGFEIYNKDLLNWLVSECGVGHDQKQVPGWLKNMNSTVLKAALIAGVKGDGYTQSGHTQKKFADNKIPRYYYVTGCEKLADDIQEIAFKAGYSPIKKPRSGEDNTWLVTWSESGVGNFPSVEQKGKEPVMSEEDYEGMVHSLNVPHHLYIVRTNGKIHITGNCGGSEGRYKLKWMVNMIGCTEGCDIVGIGIQSDYVADFYHKHVIIEDVKQLGMNVVRLIDAAFTKRSKKRNASVSEEDMAKVAKSDDCW